MSTRVVHSLPVFTISFGEKLVVEMSFAACFYFELVVICYHQWSQ
jgi:hypothetical protein